MSEITRRRLARTAAGMTTATAALVLSCGLTSAPAHATSPDPSRTLPPGVVKLNDSERCPEKTLCLYRDYGNLGPAYGIGAGYVVALKDLPMSGRTAANNISSWVNNTDSEAMLIDLGIGRVRTLAPGHSLQEPWIYNDTVDDVAWK